MKELTPLREYYDRRASEYEAIYCRESPDRRRELEGMEALLVDACRGKRVLEIACGTGYWTERIAPAAEMVVALDASSSMLDQAISKRLPGRTCLIRGDAYRLPAYGGAGVVFAGFWFSHVPRAVIPRFLAGTAAAAEPGGELILFDNLYVPGEGGALVSAPAAGGSSSPDTYKVRTLADGARHRVLKNYFGKAELESLLSPHGEGVEVRHGRFYWTARVRFR